ncbi:MAG TPA: DUF2071 domain-containing protein [Verrucomicrobiae bacterium]|nr:DUF2071 domain-containing protein [Verrucomicrobiae bacterium]
MSPSIGDELHSDAARRRLLSVKGEPLFFADWLRPVFIHYEVPAAELQREVPFELDLRDGRAYVSLVAFTMRGMRPCRGGGFAAWLFRPIAANDYLNVRTYVRHGDEPGIYFLSEWMNNPFSVRLGPVTFGLPYRFGKLNYQHQHETEILRGSIQEKIGGPAFAYEAALEKPGFVPCAADSLDEFLLERYTAFTAHKTKRRFFRIWHRPWKQQAIDASVSDDRLLREVWPWFSSASLVAANYSPGAREVWMGRAHRIA